MKYVKSIDNVWHKIDSTANSDRAPKVLLSKTKCGLEMVSDGGRDLPEGGNVCSNCNK